jgi:predicted alpha/beta-hydrolase family hydrolase
VSDDVPPLVLLWDGPRSAKTTVVLGHGAGAGMDHAFLRTVAEGLAAHGLSVVRFEFPWQRSVRMGRRRPPDALPVLQEELRRVAGQCASERLVLAGKSLGGRVATTVADELGAAGVVVFGYPFHPPGKPERLRTGHLAGLTTPTLILQGERDAFGSRAEVSEYVLSPAISVEWFEAGDHSLVPTVRSGFTAEGHLARAVRVAAGFVLGR